MTINKTLAVGAAAAALLLCPLNAAAVTVGQKAPNIVAPSAADAKKKLQLKDLRGSVVYVDFWASWCAPCQQSLPALQTLQQEMQGKGFRVLTVNVDENRADAERMIQKLKLSLPVALDPKGQWADQYALQGMPSAYLIGRDGKVRHVFTGYQGDELPDIRKKVEQALKEKHP